MPNLVAVLKREDIDEAVGSLARQISSDHQDNELILIGVLKGAFVFLADLVRRISVPVKVDFVRLASYGPSMSTSGQVRLTKDVEIDIKEKDIVIVEDIVDTGISLNYLVKHLDRKQPRSIKICTLLDKHERREIDIEIEYVGHRVKEGFLVGYGLDYAEAYRNLPAIYDLRT